MAIQFGNDKIKDIYVGSDKIKEVYYGSEKVWGEVESIQDGYWVHYDTGVKTYFGLGDSSIEDGIMSSPSWGPDCSEVQIPLGVTGLGEWCFSGCSNLTSITIPEGVTILGDDCFSDCISLTSITLPESLTDLGGSCFAFCISLTSINIPEGVTSIGYACFYICDALTLATVLPAIPPSLGDMAFEVFHESLNIKVRSPYVDDYKTATNWTAYAAIISAI